MGGLFNYDNKFFRAVNKIVDGFYASILWLLFSLPIFTIGASSTALYYTIHKSLRGNRGYVWQSFWSSFKSNFKQVTKIWLILLALIALLFVDQQIMYQFMVQESPLGSLYYFFYIALFLVAVWAVYIFTYSARFELGIKATLKNSLIIAIANLPWSVLVLVLMVGGSLIVYVSPVMITFMPAGIGCLMEMFLERIYRKYMTPEDLKKEQELDWERRS